MGTQTVTLETVKQSMLELVCEMSIESFRRNIIKINAHVWLELIYMLHGVKCKYVLLESRIVKFMTLESEF